MLGRRHLFSILLFALSTVWVHAQVEIEKPVDGSIIDFGIGLGGNVPIGILSERYGNNLNFSLGGDYITNNNWVLNAEFLYLFSDAVKEDVLAPFRSADGNLLGDDNQIVDIVLKQRGLFLGAGIGRLIPLSTKTRSGLKIVINGGVLQHNIKFADDRNSLAQVRAGRQTGYDRMTRGFALKETISYKHLSLDRRLNFEIGLDLMQGFTKEVRAINFDTGLPTNKSRLDVLIGVRLVWNIPYYSGGQETIYY